MEDKEEYDSRSVPAFEPLEVLDQDRILHT